MKKNSAPIINSIPYLKSIPESFMNPTYFPILCHIPNRTVHVFSNGDVSLCQVMEKDAIIGNIKNIPLHKIWYSKRAGQIRDIVKKKRCGGCWLSCYQETNIRFSKEYRNTVIGNSLRRFLKL